MEFDEGLGNRKPEARPAARLGELVLHLLEGPAQLLDVARRNADAGVANGNRHHAVGGQRGNGDAAALRRELHGVGQKVDQHLLEGAAVGPQREALRHLALHADAALEGARRDEPHHLVECCIDLQRLALERHAAGLDLRHVENVVDDIEQELAAAVNVARVFGIFVGPHRPEHLRQHHFREADDGVERRAQFM